MSSTSLKFFLRTIVLSLLLSACSLPLWEGDEEPTATPSPADPTPATAVEATATPGPERALTICLGQEPNTLYIYDDPNPAAQSVLDAIYDGPVDKLNYDYKPVILQELPSLQDGSANFVNIPVEEGDWVINADGEKIELIQGSRVYPAGCTDSSCIVTYKPDMNLEMEQMVVSFSLLPDLRWADGTELTSDDSIYAYDLAISSESAAHEFLLERTESYEAVDPLTVTWRGVPGYRDNSYKDNFWQPLPYHVWSAFSADELVDADVAARYPLGWGPFVVDTWEPAESIRLIKNPLYHRADEGLPKLDVINFRFISDPNDEISALLDGQCDLLDPSVSLDNHIPLLQSLAINEQISLYTTEKISLESLHFGINPASSDDGIISGNDRPPIFNDPRTRQAIAFCLDRQRVIEQVLHNLAIVPDSYVPNSHPLYTPDVNLYPHDPIEGAALLDTVGWKDLDNDPATPRTALNIPDVPTGTELNLAYITTTSLQRRQASEILAESLNECGIGVNLQYLPPESFYASGPDGILFGREFDLAQFSMGSESLIPRCDWFSTGAIPNEENNWQGANLSGYSNTDFDATCEQAAFAIPDEITYQENYRETLRIYAEELPSVPLYPYLKVAASRADLSGFSLNPSASSPLWSIELFNAAYAELIPTPESTREGTPTAFPETLLPDEEIATATPPFSPDTSESTATPQFPGGTPQPTTTPPFLGGTSEPTATSQFPGTVQPTNTSSGPPGT